MTLDQFKNLFKIESFMKNPEIYPDDSIAKKKEILGTVLSSVAVVVYYTAESIEQICAFKNKPIDRKCTFARWIARVSFISGGLFIMNANKQKSPEQKIKRAKEYRRYCDNVINEVEASGGNRWQFHNAWLPCSVAESIEREAFAEHDAKKKVS